MPAPDIGIQVAGRVCDSQSVHRPDQGLRSGRAGEQA